MPISYSIAPRKVLAGPDRDMTKFYGQVRSTNKIGFERICEDIALLSAATPGDVALVINGLMTVMCENMEEGYAVQIGDLGNFRLAAGSTGAASRKAFTAHLMKKPRIAFTPGRALTRMLGELTFVRKDHIIEEE